MKLNALFSWVNDALLHTECRVGLMQWVTVSVSSWGCPAHMDSPYISHLISRLNIIQVDCIIFKQLTHITFSFFPFSIMKKLKVFIKPRVIFRTLLLYQIFRKLLQIEQTEPRTQWQRFRGLLDHAIKEGDTGITPRAWHQQRRLRVPEVFKCVQW